jgi:hypothetical protein
LKNVLQPYPLSTEIQPDETVDSAYLPDQYYQLYTSLSELPRAFKKQKFGNKRKIVQKLYEGKIITEELCQMIQQLELQRPSPNVSKIQRLVTYHAFISQLMKEFVIC